MSAETLNFIAREGEEMHELVERTEGLGVAPSLRRYAWVSKRPLWEVVQDFEAVVRASQAAGAERASQDVSEPGGGCGGVQDG